MDARGPLPVTRVTWPKATAIPAPDAGALRRASSSAWSPTHIQSHAARTGGDAQHPWRHGDRLAQTAARRNRRIVASVVVVTAMVSASSHAIEGRLAQLQTDLAAERSRTSELSDSVSQYRVALSGRTERVVTLVASPDGVQLPVTGRITSGFSGRRLHPILNLWRKHEGVDIPAAEGTPIRPVAPGRIVSVGRELGYGLVVEIDHGSVSTRYAHLHSSSRRAGQWVSPGDVIGLVGETGLATAPHLHYEVLRGSTPVNPLTYALRVIELVPTTTRRVADTAVETVGSVPLMTPPLRSRGRRAKYPVSSVIPTSSTSSEL